MITSLIGRAATVGAVAAIALTGFGVAQLDKAVDLTVEGQLTSMHVFGSTVADALAKSGVTIGEHDLVVPAPDQAIEDGSAIVVRYGRKLTVTVDGVTSDYWTTATTVDQAMSELGIRALAGATLSVSRSAGLGREGLSLTVTNPHQVTYMLSYLEDDRLRDRVRRKAVISPHPTLPAHFYSLFPPARTPVDGKVNIGYFGTFYPNRGLGDLFTALASLDGSVRDRLAVQLHSPANPDLSRAIGVLGISDVVSVV